MCALSQHPGWHLVRPLAGLVAAVLALAAAGCATVRQTPVAEELANGATVEPWREPLGQNRAFGLLRAREHVEGLRYLPLAQLPGLSALHRQLGAELARLDPARGQWPTRDQVDAWTLRNPAFWHATLELPPHDTALLRLHVSLLMAAGETQRALLAGVLINQAWPVSEEERTFWLWVVLLNSYFAELRDREGPAVPPGNVTRRERALMLESARRQLEAWPGDWWAATRVIVLPAQEAVRARRGGAEELAAVARGELAPAERAALADEIVHYGHVHPIGGLRFALPPEEFAAFEQEFAAVVRTDKAVDERRLRALGERFFAAGELEAGYLVVRILTARRGFSAPAEQDRIRAMVAAWIEPDALATWERRVAEERIAQVQLSAFAPPPLQALPHIDPAAHPLLAEWLVREIARETFLLNHLNWPEEEKARHFERRAIWESGLGRHREALADVDRALALMPDDAGLIATRAWTLSQMGQLAEAEAEFARARAVAPDKPPAMVEGMHLLKTGRAAEAEAVFRAVFASGREREFSAIFGELAARLHGGCAADLVAAARAATDPTSWPAALLAFLAGELDRDGLLARAAEGSDQEIAEQRSEGFYVLGEVALAAGQREEAERDFEACVNSGVTYYIEHHLATVRLADLRPLPTRVPEPARPRPAERDDPSPARSRLPPAPAE